MTVVVVGAGVYGAAVTASLTERGAHVLLVEAAAAGGGTSGATFAWTNSSGRHPRPYHDLRVAGMEAHRRLAAAVPGSDWYHESGNLEWVAGDDEREKLRTRVAGLVARGYETQWLSRAEVVALEPGIAPDELPAAEIVFFPREGWLEPARLIGHLLASSAARGAELVTGDPVTGLEIPAGGGFSVRLASGRRIAAEAVVNCAGPQADEIARLAGLDLPMRNTRGVLVRTAPTAPTAAAAVPVSRVVRAPRVHLRPDGSGGLLLHSAEIDRALGTSDTGEISVAPSAVEELLEAGRTLYPGTRPAAGATDAAGTAGTAGTAAHSVLVGERPIPTDGLPVLGRVADLPRFHFAVSHSGATLCLHAGDLVAAEVLGEDRGEALAAFRFERFRPPGG
ncbi:NAD(P)/FAD-dependent oxidoreductase [Parafrankia sp. FMc2]|uniref:NAD(P)/FAD-dependent oxidoreductase n=1 Tax=Parafrankia sp. FMc2 TaxID=3233196 RepID=UPI0034D3D8E8